MPPLSDRPRPLVVKESDDFYPVSGFFVFLLLCPQMTKRAADSDTDSSSLGLDSSRMQTPPNTARQEALRGSPVSSNYRAAAMAPTGKDTATGLFAVRGASGEREQIGFTAGLNGRATAIRARRSPPALATSGARVGALGSIDLRSISRDDKSRSGQLYERLQCGRRYRV